MQGPFPFDGIRVTGRSLLRCAAGPLVGLAIAAGFVVAVERQPASGAFAAGTVDSGNSVTSATNFCTSPGTVLVPAAADNSVSQSGADALANASDVRLRVISRYSAPSSLNHRAFVRFDLPTRRTGCTLTATLKLYLDVAYAGRILDAHLVDPVLPLWAEGGFRYSTQPAVVAGTAVGYSVVSATPTFAQWTVTSSIQAQYGGTHNGFLIRDRVENDSSGAAVEQAIVSREAPNSGGTLGKQPVLELVWS